jgi:hypothetical protein
MISEDMRGCCGFSIEIVAPLKHGARRQDDIIPTSNTCPIATRRARKGLQTLFLYSFATEPEEYQIDLTGRVLKALGANPDLQHFRQSDHHRQYPYNQDEPYPSPSNNHSHRRTR